MRVQVIAKHDSHDFVNRILVAFASGVKIKIKMPSLLEFSTYPLFMNSVTLLIKKICLLGRGVKQFQ